MKILLPLILILAGLHSVTAQPNLRQLNFSAPDSVALKTTYNGDLIGLSRSLTQPFDSDVMKVRAIYKWMIENIAYDYKLFNKAREPKSFSCSSKEDCKIKEETFKWQLAKKVADKKKGICSGYALLFKLLCNQSGIKCEVVPGAVRSEPYQVGNNAPEDHAWNAVWIDSNWYFIDVTWAAGGCPKNEETGKLGKFVKKQKDFYFLTPYEKHIKNHHPREARWYALLNNTTKEQFNRQPYYYDASHFINYLENVTPDSGMIALQKSDTLHFSFEYPFEIEKIQVNTNLKRSPDFWEKGKRKRMIFDTSAERRQVYIPFKKEVNRYSFDVPVVDRSLYYIEIRFKYLNKKEPVYVLKYRVDPHW